MSQEASIKSSLQKQSHSINVIHLELDNEDSALYQSKTNPKSNVSKSSDFTDILKQWKRINGKKFDSLTMKQESEINGECKVFRTCNCIKRLIFMMGFYAEWSRKNDKKKQCKGLTINDIIEGLPYYDIIQLWNDFIHAKQCHFIQNNYIDITETIQVWDYIESKLGTYDMTKCNKFARNNRDRSISGNQQQRELLYYGLNESEEIVTIQFCDIIWEFLFHSKILFKNEYANRILFDPQKIEKDINIENDEDNDNKTDNNNDDDMIYNKRKSSKAQRRSTSITNTIGKRIIQRLEKQKEKELQQTAMLNKTDNNNNNNNNNNNIEFKYSDNDKQQFEEYIDVKNEVLNNLERDNLNKNIGKNGGEIKSKFITNVYSHNTMDKKSISFGVSFVYWDGYSSWHTFIKHPTFNNLKQEMFNNPYYKITIYQWNDTLIKSIKLNKTNIGNKWVAKNAGILNKRYSIKSGLPISIPHIMSILFYINYKDLQYAFKTNGCRKLTKRETTNDVKKRNKNIGNWYKLFTECITLYGEITNSSQIFYHGLSEGILLDAFKPNFNCMISTTSSLSVAQSIISNNNGIIIKLQQKRSLPYGFLNVHWITDFQNQSEKIFSFSRLDIVDIYQNIPTFQSNTVYVKSLILFQSIVKGHYFQHTLHENYRYQKVIIAMIQSWMKQNNVNMDDEKDENEKNIDIPPYMQQLFNSFINKQNKLYVIRSQYDHLYDALKTYLIDFDDDDSYEFGSFFNGLKNKNINNTLKLILMKEFKWKISGDTMKKFKELPINNTIKGKYFHAGSDVVLYPRLRRSDRDFPDKSMMFCYVEDMPSNYNRIYIQWELFCKETNYHSSQTRFLKKKEFAGYTVSNTNDLCSLDSFTFEISVQILDIDQSS